MKPEKIKINSGILAQIKLTAYLGLFVAGVFLIITSCTATRKQPTAKAFSPAYPESENRYSSHDEIEKRLRQEYGLWKGTRHRMGGNGDSGIDCSGFVRAVYKDVFHMDLPRTTRAQAKLGRPITFNEIRAGDLVFFKPPTYPRHVGIFLSGSEFVHASKESGVTVSRIDKYYWGKYYWTARRILPATE